MLEIWGRIRLAQYSAGYLEAIATGLSRFAPCSLPELDKSVPSIQLVLKLGMLEGLFVKLKPVPSATLRQLARRSHGAQQAYIEMRIALDAYFLDFVADSPRFGQYFRALDLAEYLLINLHIAFDSIKAMPDLIPYNDDDGFVCRVNDLSNELKHLGGRRKGSGSSKSANLPIYFLNSGITNGTSAITFVELAENLKSLSDATIELVDCFSEMNPLHSILRFN